jgi:His/Glu/Gln/Arg/opine family amino acid ABC transporter permease subunit
MKKSTKAKVRRGILYGTLILIFAIVVIAADWPTIQKAFFNPEIAAEMFPEVITVAAKNTIIYTALAFTFGLILALILALMKRSDIKPYKWIATTYIELFRGLPALVTIILVGFGLPIAMGVRIPGGTLGKGTVGLGIVVHGRDHPGRNRSRPQGTDGGGSLTGHEQRSGNQIHRPTASVPDHHPAAHQRAGDPHQGHLAVVRSGYNYRHQGANQIRARFHERHIQRHAADCHRAHVLDHHAADDEVCCATREACSEGEVNHG